MKKAITFLQQHVAVATIIFVLALAQQSCKKTGADTQPADPATEAFLSSPPGTNAEILQVIENLKVQFATNNFAADFLAWHGKPVWNAAIKLKSTGDDIVLLIPAVKENELMAFMEVKYNKKEFLYQLHRKSAIINKLQEYSNIGLTEANVKQFMSYFENKLGTAKAMPAYKTSQMNALCWYETCANAQAKSSAHPVPDVPCWIYVCIPDGGGGGGGNWPDDGGGTGGGGGGNPPMPSPEPCQQNVWYKLVPEQCVPDGCNVSPADVLASGYATTKHISTFTTPEINNNGEITREKYYDWQFYEGKFLWYSWSYISKDKSVQVKIGNTWKFKSMEHLTHTENGTSPFSTSCTINYAVPSVSADKNYGYMKLDYTVKVEINCGFTTSSTQQNYPAVTNKYLITE